MIKRGHPKGITRCTEQLEVQNSTLLIGGARPSHSTLLNTRSDLWCRYEVMNNMIYQLSWRPNATIFALRNWRYSLSIEFSILSNSWYYPSFVILSSNSVMLLMLVRDSFDKSSMTLLLLSLPLSILRISYFYLFWGSIFGWLYTIDLFFKRLDWMNFLFSLSEILSAIWLILFPILLFDWTLDL